MKNVPKPMAPVNKRPFIEYILDYWISQDVTRFILSVGYLKEKIISHFGTSYKGVKIEYVIETEPLGTGGGLILASENLSEDFLVINGDTFIEVDLNKFYKFHNENRSQWSFALFKANDHKRFLPLGLSKKFQINFSQSNNKENFLANGGVYLMSPSLLKQLNFEIRKKISLEEQILSKALDCGSRIFGFITHGNFLDIGLPEDYKTAGKFMKDLNF